MNVQSAMPTVDLSTIKGRQQLAWSSGDYAIVGTTLQIVGETLCEAVDLRSNQRVLDVAAGNGNATLAAARRFADVVSTDYVGALLEGGTTVRLPPGTVTWRAPPGSPSAPRRAPAEPGGASACGGSGLLSRPSRSIARPHGRSRR